MDILGASITASFTIILIILLKKLLKKGISARVYKMLWLIPITRLLFPLNFLGTAMFTGDITADGSGAVKVYDVPINPNSMTIDLVIPDILRYVWLFGAVFTGALYFFSHMKTRKKFSSALPCGYDIEPVKRLLNIGRKVRLKVSELADSPFTYGVAAPVIILPKTMDMNNETELKNILLHELSHVKSFDAFLRFLLAVCTSLYWFDPFVWIMSATMCRDAELACDECAITKGKLSREEYALTLISAEENRYIPQAAGFMGGKLEERIIAVMRPAKNNFFCLAFSFFVILYFALTVNFAVTDPRTENGYVYEYSTSATGTAEISEAVLGAVEISEAVTEGTEISDVVFVSDAVKISEAVTELSDVYVTVTETKNEVMEKVYTAYDEVTLYGYDEYSRENETYLINVVTDDTSPKKYNAVKISGESLGEEMLCEVYGRPA